MAQILTPGFLRWDGLKYVLDPDVTGSLGPTIINSGIGVLPDIVSDENQTPASIIVFTGSASMSVTGIQGGVESREIRVFNVDSDARLTIRHQDGTSSVDNRIITPGGIDFVLKYQEGAVLVYSIVESRWRVTERGLPSGVANDVVGLDGAGSLINLGPLPVITPTSDGPTITNASSGTLSNIISDEGGTLADVIRFTGSSSSILTGIAGGLESRKIQLVARLSDGGGTLTIKNNNSGSLPANRIKTPGPGNADFILQYDSAVEVVYDNIESLWKIVASPLTSDTIGTGSNGQVLRTTSSARTWSPNDLPSITITTNNTVNNCPSTDGSGNPAGIIRFSPTNEDDVVVTGISGGYDGRMVTLMTVVGAEGGGLFLEDGDEGSSSSNQFDLSNYNSGEVTIRNNGSVVVQYDGFASKWRVVGEPVSNFELPTFYSSLFIQNLETSGISTNDTFGRWSAGTFTSFVNTSGAGNFDFGAYVDMLGDGAFFIDITVVMTRQTSATKAGVYRRSALFRRTGFGAATIVGAVQTPVPDQETTAGDDVTIVTVGPSIKVRVTSADADPRRWVVEYKYKSVDSNP